VLPNRQRVSALLPTRANLDHGHAGQAGAVGLGADLSNIQKLRLPATHLDSRMMSGTGHPAGLQKNTQLLARFPLRTRLNRAACRAPQETFSFLRAFSPLFCAEDVVN
jgi:hypothetical protein